MSVIIALIWIVTALQLLSAKFSLWFLLCVLARTLFSLRCVGATFKYKTLCLIEGVSLLCFMVWNFMFKGNASRWYHWLFALICGAVCLGLMLLDEILYVYITEDCEEEEEAE